MEILCFSANVHRYNIAFSAMQVQVCFKYFLCITIFFFLHYKGSEQISKTYLVFRLVCTNEKYQLHPQY